MTVIGAAIIGIIAIFIGATLFLVFLIPRAPLIEEPMDLSDLRWTCHVCGNLRPDAKISVASADVSHFHNMPPGTIQRNVRYCNDSDECQESAFTMANQNPPGTDP